MFKLLINYIREQKNNWLQVVGLGFLVIIMIGSFLSLTFGASYVNDNYKNEIAQGEFHQDISFQSSWDANFRWGNIKNPWLENINYVSYDEDNESYVIDGQKMVHATFQLQKLATYDEGNNHYFYRFYFYDPENYVRVGSDFAQDTGKKFIDFQLSVPPNYPSVEEYDTYVKEQAAIINRFVYDPKISYDQVNEANKTNFFILNSASALTYYNTKIKPENVWAKRDYNASDVSALAKIYYYLTTGMLWGNNVSWDRAIVIKDLLISGKTLAFLQTTKNDKVNAPVVVEEDNSLPFDSKNLADDEILIYQKFAKENNLKIGDNLFFSGYKFKIVGFATSAFSANNNYYFNGLSDNKNQTVAFINQPTMEKLVDNPFVEISNDRFIFFNPEEASKNIAGGVNNEWIYQYFHQKLVNNSAIDKTMLYGIDNGVDSRMLFGALSYNFYYYILENWVWATLKDLTNIFVQVASVFLVLIFIVASIIIFIVVFKMIDRNKQLIGILKANGYQSWKLSIVLVTAIVFPIILFALVAVALSVLISHFIVIAYSSVMMLTIYGFPFYWAESLLVITIPILFLFIVSTFFVTILLRVDALTLINNSWAKNKYNSKVSSFFKAVSSKVVSRFNFKNKLALTTTFRSFGKVIFVSLVSVFASTLLLFSLSATGLINNMLGLQFASVNYNFNSQYKFQDQVYRNFVNSDNQLLYKKEETKEILKKPSLYDDLLEAVIRVIANPNQPEIFDFRYGYLRGSKLYELRRDVIEPNFNKLPAEFQEFWNQNIYWIDYLTNNNGKNQEDLIINFGLLPYDQSFENPYTQMSLSDPHDFDIATIDADEYYYDNDNQIFVGDWSKYSGAERVVQGVNEQSEQFLVPNLRNTYFKTFTNLTLDNMKIAGGWINTNFLQIRQNIIDKFKIDDPENSSVKIIPMAGSIIAGANDIPGGDGNNIGKTVLYRYRGFDGHEQYIIGIIYDGARNLLPNTVIMPNNWLNQAIFNNDEELIKDFANSKFSNFSSNELNHYLPIISEKNDYKIDLTKIAQPGYLPETKAVSSGLETLYDVNAIREILRAQQYTYQILIALFAIFSILLSFMIIIIISNINIRDNLILINILRSLGYTSGKVSYIFLIVMLPLIVVFSLFAVLIAPFLSNFLASSLAVVIAQQIPIIFLWWYYAIPVFVIVLIYLLSFIITWKLNVNNRQLMTLTK